MDNKCVICDKELIEGDHIYTLVIPSKTKVNMCIKHKGTQELDEYISNIVRTNDLVGVGSKIFFDKK